MGEGVGPGKTLTQSSSGLCLWWASPGRGQPAGCFPVALSPHPVPPMFQKAGEAEASFEILSLEEARGGVTEYREVVESNPAYLYCDTNAIPPPELTWYREDQPLSATDGVSVLQGRQGRSEELRALGSPVSRLLCDWNKVCHLSGPWLQFVSWAGRSTDRHLPQV